MTGQSHRRRWHSGRSLRDRFHGNGTWKGARSRFYLDKKNAKFMGVCAGIADYIGTDPLWIRIAAVLLVLFGVPFLIIVYLIIGWIAPIKPEELYDEPEEERVFWREVRTRPQSTVQNVRLKFRDLERRVRDIEAYTTSSARRLDREIEKLRDA